MFEFKESKKKVLEWIGENKSDYPVDAYVRALKDIQRGLDWDDDYSAHVVDRFNHMNGKGFIGNYNSLCIKFLGVGVVSREDEHDESGPYGGAFKDEDDLFFYREGYHIY